MRESRLSAWDATDVHQPIRSPRDRVERLVRCAVLAPSCHNTQPWRFRIGDEWVELWADRGRQLHAADPDGRELAMSCGAALLNLRVACRHHEREGAITLLPDPDEPDLFARAGCGSEHAPTAQDWRLFDAIWRRHTNRRPFEARPVADRVLAALAGAADHEGARLYVVEADRRRALAALIDEADRVQLRDRAFRRELAVWTAPTRARRGEGIPGYALGSGDGALRVARWVARTFDLALEIGRPLASPRRSLADTAPALVVLATARDSEAHWLRAGQALQRVLLTATAEGLCASFLNQPVEVPGLRPHVCDAAGVWGAPQVILRLGYGSPCRPTPRRPLADVVHDPDPEGVPFEASRIGPPVTGAGPPPRPGAR